MSSFSLSPVVTSYATLLEKPPLTSGPRNTVPRPLCALQKKFGLHSQLQKRKTTGASFLY